MVRALRARRVTGRATERGASVVRARGAVDREQGRLADRAGSRALPGVGADCRRR